MADAVFIKSGMKLAYEMAGFDSKDRYTFTVGSTSPNLALHHQMGTSDEGDVEIAAAALENARCWLSISQGSVGTHDHKGIKGAVTKDLPPFLLSRAAFADLKAKKKMTFRPQWADEKASEWTLDPKKASLHAVINGKKTSVPVLHALCKSASGILEAELWVADDAVWPVILKREESDDCYWLLKEAGTKVVASSGEDDD